MKKNPCTQDCPKRNATCHATCEEYIEFATERNELHEIRHKAVAKEQAFRELRSTNAIRSLKRRRKGGL